MNLTLLAHFRGASLSARVLRSSMLTVGSFGYAQAMRLGTNLILTRLLFPEAFGMMSLVGVVLMGLAQFSDVGTTPAILSSKRGDDPSFLDTAWTIQALRGIALWLVACLLAWPVSIAYGEPMLAQLLPVAALTLVISGFRPTRMDTANRHLMLGRVTVLEIVTQSLGAITAVLLAWITGSVWALVLSGVLGSVLEVALNSLYLPGHRNSFRWEKAAARELVSFGKWVFLATVCGFLFTQADKLLIGKYLPLDLFGVYSIGYFLAAFPMMLGGMVTRKVLIPIYREAPPSKSRAHFLKIRRMRFGVTSALLMLVGTFAALGVWLVHVLYDPRYAMAGAVTVLVACAQMPQIIVLTYDQAALAAGDSKRFFILAAARAALMVGGLLVGLSTAGLLGGIVGFGCAYLAAYPVVVWLARRMGAWDPLHDAVFAVMALLIASVAIWLNGDAIAAIPGAGG